MCGWALCGCVAVCMCMYRTSPRAHIMFDDKSVDYDMYFEGTERRRSANLTAANPLRSPRQLSQSAISFQGEDGLT
jgi:hypothetical protein